MSHETVMVPAPPPLARPPRLSVAYADVPFLRSRHPHTVMAVLAAVILLMIMRNVLFYDYRQEIRGELMTSGLAPELVERYAPKTVWERHKDAAERNQELQQMRKDIDSLLEQVNELNRIIQHHKLDATTATAATLSQKGTREN